MVFCPRPPVSESVIGVSIRADFLSCVDDVRSWHGVTYGFIAPAAMPGRQRPVCGL